MLNTIGIRWEAPESNERRVPLTPEQVGRLVSEYGLRVIVAPSDSRVFTDAEFIEAGAEISTDLSPCNVIFGVKEVPLDRIKTGPAYFVFSHTVKAQRYNMPMLARFIERGTTLIDYELVTNDNGRRLIFFGDFAGYAGMINTLWALGRRLEFEGIASPFATLKRAFEYPSLADAEAAVTAVGQQIRAEELPKAISPLVCIFTGRGHVSRGAQKIFKLLPCVSILPEDIPELAASGSYSRSAVYAAEFRREHLYEPKEKGKDFSMEDLEANPDAYTGTLDRYVDATTMIVNGIYWSPRYPRLLTNEMMRKRYQKDDRPALRVIGDITCDIEGSIEFTKKATTSDNPVFVYEPLRDEIVDGVDGDGPVVLAVDRLPTELPREASQSFGEGLLPFVRALAAADLTQPFESLDVPGPIKKAIIAHQGRLTEHFRYLGEHLL